ncbi:MAG: hypothetical protein RSF40_07375 [Oscillospiraceae bacterium]
MFDGTLIFYAKIDNRGIEKDAKSTKSNLLRIAKSTATMKNAMVSAFETPSSKITDLNGKISSTELEIDKLSSEMSEIARTPFKADFFEKMQKEADKTGKKLLDLLNKREMLENQLKTDLPLGLKMSGNDFQTYFEGNSEWKKLSKDIEMVDSSLSSYETKIKEVKLNEAFIDPKETNKYKDKELKLSKLNAKLDTYKTKLSEAESSTKAYGNATSSTGKKVSAMTRLIKMSIQALAMMALFKIVQTITDGLTEGVQNLAKYSNKYNAVISQLKSANTQFKNSIATAVAPLVQMATPYLVTFIEKLAKVADTVAQVSAALFGNATVYVRSKKVNQDYAEGLDKTKKKVDDLTSSIDELNIAGKDESLSSGSGELSPNDMFDTVTIGDDAQSIASKIKKAFEPLKPVLDNLKTSFEGLKTAIDSLEDNPNFNKIKEFAYDLAKLGVKMIIDGVADALVAMSKGIDMVNNALSGDWSGAFKSYVETMDGIVQTIRHPFETLNGFINGKIEGLKISEGAKTAFKTYGSLALTGFMDGITRGLWSKIIGWGSIIINAVKTALDIHSPSKVFEWLGTMCKDGFINAILTMAQRIPQIFKDVINGVITIFEKGINFIISSLSILKFDIPDKISKAIGIKSFGFNVDPIKLPRLAKGDVIPPNNEFLAILGDQKRGVNIEAPADLIAQIVRENSGAGSVDILIQILQAIKNIDFQAVVNVNDREIARASNAGNKSLGYAISG